MQVWKASEWQSATGLWQCGNISNLAHMSNSWLHPCRIMAMTPADYVKWVVENFNPIVWHNTECDLIFFSWERQSDMRRFKNFINSEAKRKNYLI